MFSEMLANTPLPQTGRTLRLRPRLASCHGLQLSDRFVCRMKMMVVLASVAGRLSAAALVVAVATGCSDRIPHEVPAPAAQAQVASGGPYSVQGSTRAADGHCTVVLSRLGTEADARGTSVTVALYGEIPPADAAQLVNMLASNYPTYKLDHLTITSERPGAWTILTVEDGTGTYGGWGYIATVVREHDALRIVGITGWTG
jgi:hypothetical protein